MRYTPTDRQAVEFFARLANIVELSAIPKEEMYELLSDLRAVMAAILHEARERRGPSPPGGFALELDRHWEQSLLETLLIITHGEARRCVLDLLHGKETALPLPGKMTGSLRGRTLVETFTPITESQQLFPVLLRVLRHHPFPFGQCVQCQRVFVQSPQGKPRRFCSLSCKYKGIPSAANRTAYARTARQRKRQEELTTARRIVQGWPEAEQWPMLEKAFPRKSRRQILSVVKQAAQKKRHERTTTAKSTPQRKEH